VRAVEAQRGEKDAADLLRRTWTRDGIPAAFPVDPIIIARDLEIEVRISRMKPNASGALMMEMVNEELHAVIHLNSSDAPVRQRFTCAHELGHYVNRVNRGQFEGRVVDWRDQRSRTGTQPDEVHANAFAAALLMPADIVRGLAANSHTVQMALFFEVSVEAMDNRLRALDAE
jgi:Zn-dependent peptidase ImmA (M78 family)